MSNEEAIAIIRNEYKCVDRDCDIERSCGKCDLMMPNKEPILEAYKLAIKALEQQPCDDAISRQAVLDRIRESIETYHNQYTTDMLNMWGLFTQFIKEMPSVSPQPCSDAISRDMALEKMADYVASGYADSAEDFEEYSRIICQLPPVTPQQKYGKWIKHPEIETSTPEYLMFYECSECGDKQCFCKSDLHKKRFCNSCGAKMQESEVRNNGVCSL